MSILVNNKKVCTTYIQAVEPSNPIHGQTWYNSNTEELKIFEVYRWVDLFKPYSTPLGEHTFLFKTYGIELELLVKISPLMKLYGVELEMLVKISPLMKLYGVELEMLVKEN